MVAKLTIKFWIGFLIAAIAIAPMPCWAQDNAGTGSTEPATDALATRGEEAFTTEDAALETSTNPPPVEENSLCYKLSQALAKITSDKRDTVCTLNSVCNGLVCNFTAFSMKLWVLPCAHPPVVRMAIVDNQGEKLFDDVVMKTARVQGQNYSLEVEYDHQEEEFGLQISDDNIGILFPYTTFSTDPSQCFQTVCETISAAITSSEANDTSCSPTTRCDGAVCIFTDSIPITMTAKIVECHDPPAVQLIIDNPFSEKDRDLVNGLFTTTSKVNVFGYEILVTVHQLGGGIGVEIIGGPEEEGMEEEGTFPPFPGEGSGFPPFPEFPDFPTDFPPFPTDFPPFPDEPNPSEDSTGGPEEEGMEEEGTFPPFPEFPDFPTDFPPFPTDFPPFPDEPDPSEDSAGGEEEESSASSDGLLEYRFFPVDQSKPECEVFSLTCLGLQGVVDRAARSNITCQINAKCDTLNCFVDVFQNGAQFPLSMTFNSCREPRPSVYLVLRNPDSGKIVLRREVDRSMTISIFEHIIEVTVDQIPEEDGKPYPSIGFAIDLMSPPDEGQAAEAPEPINVIRYSEVPVLCDPNSEAYRLSSFTMSSITVLVLTIAAVVNY